MSKYSTVYDVTDELHELRKAGKLTLEEFRRLAAEFQKLMKDPEEASFLQPYAAHVGLMK